MIIELSWAISEDDLRQTHCCVCNKSFERGVVEINVLSDSDRYHIGEACPACIYKGAEYMEAVLQSRLRFRSTIHAAGAEMERRASEESISECPSYEEYDAFAASCAGPRYATGEEAQAAWERGEW